MHEECMCTSHECHQNKRGGVTQNSVTLNSTLLNWKTYMPIVNHMFSLGSDRLCIRQETGIVHTITYSCFLTCNTKYNNKHAS